MSLPSAFKRIAFTEKHQNRKHPVIQVLCDQMNAVGIKHLTETPETRDGKQRQRVGSFQTTETQPQLIKTSVSIVLVDV